MYTNDSWFNYTKFIVDFDIEKPFSQAKDSIYIILKSYLIC